jgi:hypothetical protein
MAGETKTSLVSTALPLFTSKSVGQVVAQPWSVELLSTDLETNDITAVARIPKGSTYLGCFVKTDDLDTGTPTLVWSILVGATAVAAALGNDTALGGTFLASTAGPVTVTADTLINAKATTAANVGAAGTFQIVPVYITSA